MSQVFVESDVISFKTGLPLRPEVVKRLSAKWRREVAAANLQSRVVHQLTERAHFSATLIEVPVVGANVEGWKREFEILLNEPESPGGGHFSVVKFTR